MVPVECPVCQGEGEATVVVASVPGYREPAVDDVSDLSMSCACLQSPYVQADVLRAALLEQARGRALEAA